jgi:hypothetical protein
MTCALNQSAIELGTVLADSLRKIDHTRDNDLTTMRMPADLQINALI